MAFKIKITANKKAAEKDYAAPRQESICGIPESQTNPALIGGTKMNFERDFSGLTLADDHEQRPVWVTPKGHIFLETFSPIYKQAYDFLIAIADPVSRPCHIHEYKITQYSLYAAASLGLSTEAIISGLQRLSKNELDQKLIAHIVDRSSRCGKVKLCLKKNRYFIESKDPKVLDLLLSFEAIGAARIDHPNMKRRMPTPPPDVVSNILLRELEEKFKATDIPLKWDDATGYITSDAGGLEGLTLQGTKDGVIDQNSAMGLVDEDFSSAPVPKSSNSVYAFEIDERKSEDVRRMANLEIKEGGAGYPLMEEYDFRRDTSSLNLPMDLKPHAAIREYQVKSLSKMFGNGRARSGIIVLPCGAGKTLVGITAAQTIKKSTLVFCTTGVAVDQWRRQFLRWTTLPEKYIRMFTSGVKDKFKTDAKVIITTYTMVAYNGKRSAEAEEVMKVITSQEWGLILLDEVHVAPAEMFRKCVNLTHSRCKLGLTATLVREDDKIDDLYYLLGGPKLYEANWLDLQRAGHLATVQCFEVWCDMTAEFYQKYLQESSLKQKLLYVMNPTKFRMCEHLIRLHEAKGDKILVFSDNVYAIKKYAHLLEKPYIFGGTSDAERIQFLKHFQTDDNINTLFISKIGDNSIDLPDVNVIIQIASHYASRRQEAQRLGRIMRPKDKGSGRTNAYFYTLVSKDTKEMMYASKRQRFLVAQGYEFKVLTQRDLQLDDSLHFSNKESQLELLADILATDDANGGTEEFDENGVVVSTGIVSTGVTRKRGTSSALSGGADLAYAEFNAAPGVKKSKGKSAMFETREKQKKERARVARKEKALARQ